MTAQSPPGDLTIVFGRRLAFDDDRAVAAPVKRQFRRCPGGDNSRQGLHALNQAPEERTLLGLLWIARIGQRNTARHHLARIKTKLDAQQAHQAPSG